MSSQTIDATSDWLPPSVSELVTEQTELQTNKIQDRTLEGYEYGHIFAEQFAVDAGGEPSNLLNLLYDQAGGIRVNTIAGLLTGMATSKERDIHWADMGAGYAIALRQMGIDETLREKVRRTAVDLNYPELITIVVGTEKIYFECFRKLLSLMLNLILLVLTSKTLFYPLLPT